MSDARYALSRAMSRARAHPHLIIDKIHRESKRVFSPSTIFFEANHDVSNTLLVIGSGRSGSTWLGELLSRAPDCRFIFEAFHKNTASSFEEFSRNLYHADEGHDQQWIDLVIDRALSGRIRSKWSDQFNQSRRPIYRVLKERNASNLLPYISERYPNLTIIYLLRHPLAVAWSWTRLNWDELGGAFTSQNQLMDTYFAAQRRLILRQSFVSNVYRWCLENTVPIQSSQRESVLLVFYEKLFKHPYEELQRIQLFLQRHSPGHWVEWEPDLTEIDRPSAMELTTESSSEWLVGSRVDRWQEQVPPDFVSAGLEVVAEFGLDWLYGDSPMPLVGPDDLPIARV